MSVVDLVRRIGDLAYYYEITYHGCSQSTLKALQDSLNIGDNLSFKAATALAAGIARTGEACGALLGGIMAIGLAYGRDRLEEITESEGLEAMDLSEKLYDRFKEEFGSIKCFDIQKEIFGRGFNLRDEKDREEFFKAYNPNGCPQVVRKGAILAAELILRSE
ncbi:MAG: C-GCAxxG-C-C family protein [Candidatus Hodarchaeota archaeon]